MVSDRQHDIANRSGALASAGLCLYSSSTTHWLAGPESEIEPQFASYAMGIITPTPRRLIVIKIQWDNTGKASSSIKINIFISSYFPCRRLLLPFFI